MYLKTQALVLRVSDYNDHDAMLTVLTREYGKLSVKVRGLRRKNSPMIAPCQLLAYAEFTLFEYKGMYTANEAHSIELFQGLRRDLVKLSLGTYFAQVAEIVSQEDTPNAELMSLLLNCLFALSSRVDREDKIKAVFELRCACIAGYTPDLYGCHQCGNSYPDRFDVSAGILECKNCRSAESDGLRIPLSPGTLDAMRYIVSSDSKRIFSFDLSNQTFEQLAHLTETYLTTQLERGFSTLDFYKSLIFSV